MPALVERVAAVEATRSRFAGKPFAWGRVDCAKVAAWHLRRLGHGTSGLARAGSYRSAIGARAALKRAGFADLTAALDAIGLVRVPGAAAWAGDLVVLPGTERWDAIGIWCGTGAVLAFGEEAEGLATVILAEPPREAWRV